MKKLLKALVGAVIASTLWLCTEVNAKSFYGRVIKVYDGDTITVQMCDALDLKVRLIGVDTPELKQSGGVEVRDYVRKLIMDKTVRVVLDKRQNGPYGRILGYVFVDNVFINLRLIEEGYAVPLFYRPNVQYQQEFEEVAAEAQLQGKGLWGTGEFNQTPKEFRDAQDDI
jgi:micrococcal nuclease